MYSFRSLNVSWQRVVTEFVVILCGVLAALAAGSAMENYRERQSAREALVSLRDDIFQRWNANLRILDVTEVKTVPYVPLSHPFIERLIGTVRREYLDQVPFWSTRDLERKLMTFQNYYNKDRVHRGLEYEFAPNTISELQAYEY